MMINGNIFKQTMESGQLYGNQSCLVSDKSIESWLESALIFDISLRSHSPITSVKLNEQLEICIHDNNQLCISIYDDSDIQKK